jgi:16S rRNA (cytosine967-C5)-methyltransferase
MTARDHALLELDAKRLPGWKSNLVRQSIGSLSDARDLGLSGQIVAGVVKNLFLLQNHLTHYSGKKLPQIDPLVQKILVIALYQLEFLSRIPQSATVDQAVEQAKHFGRRKSAGFVNAVLRNATRQPQPAAMDAVLDPQQYAQLELSHPPELFQRLAKLLGSARAIEFCRHDNREPPTLVRMFAGVEATALKSDGVEIIPHEESGIFVVKGARQPLLAKWAQAGLAQVQDATAAKVISHLDLRTGQIALDRCAGLGTKTLQMQERVGNTGLLVAIDPSSVHCAQLISLLKTRGISNVKVYQTAELSTIDNELHKTKFDRVLVDVPCSNSGVLSRRPEARYAQDNASLASLSKLQEFILNDTAPFVATSGLMVYSTCSIWPEENQNQIKRFLSRHIEFQLTEELTTLPGFETPDPLHYRDGGYFAVLSKTSK